MFTGELDTDTHRYPWLGRICFFSRVSVLLLAIVAVKILVHRMGWEVLDPNLLCPALVASEVFLLGFLLNGVLMDYKESEKYLAGWPLLWNASPWRQEPSGRFIQKPMSLGHWRCWRSSVMSSWPGCSREAWRAIC
jgi:hypothetical protein